jgi:hypothetical protein
VKVVVFLGPTLAVDAAREILDACYLPPAGQGDLLNATMRYRPDVIALIDGVFHQRLSVWHKEILHAIGSGVLVYGASSMGALRAAETGSYGMRGVGRIYRMYADGVLADDDEVAVAHAGAEDGYQKTSEPMVNVRATVEAACEAGVLGSADAAAFIALAKRMYFPDRSYPAIWRAAVASGIGADVVTRLRDFVLSSQVDLKRQDAVELLETIRDLTRSGTLEPVETAPFVLARSTFDALYHRDRLVRHLDTDVALESIGYHVALHDEDFDDLNFRALNRSLVQVLARLLNLRPSEQEIEAELGRFQTRRKLDTEDRLGDWLRDNDLDAGEFRTLMTEVATCRRLHKWFILARWMERTTQVVLDELRLEDRYVNWAERAAVQESLLAGDDDSLWIEGGFPPLDALVQEHADWTGVRPAVAPGDWAEEAGFHGVGNLRIELARAGRAREKMLKLLAETMSDEL